MNKKVVVDRAETATMDNDDNRTEEDVRLQEEEEEDELLHAW